MRRRRPWIGLAALLALGGCCMSPPSPVDALSGGGWGRGESGDGTAPPPVAVPPGTPDAPRPVAPTQPAKPREPIPPPGPSSAEPVPSPAKPEPVAKVDPGRQPLRLPLMDAGPAIVPVPSEASKSKGTPVALALPDAAALPASGGPSPRLIAAGDSPARPADGRSPSIVAPDALGFVGRPTSPGLKVNTGASVSEPEGSTLRIGDAGAPAMPGDAGASPAIPVAAGSRSIAADGRSPSISLGAMPVADPAVGARPGISVDVIRPATTPSDTPVRLVDLPGAAGVLAGAPASSKVNLRPAQSLAVPGAGTAPSLGQLPGAPAAEPGPSISPGLKVSAAQPMPVVAGLAVKAPSPAPAKSPGASAVAPAVAIGIRAARPSASLGSSPGGAPALNPTPAVARQDLSSPSVAVQTGRPGPLPAPDAAAPLAVAVAPSKAGSSDALVSAGIASGALVQASEVAEGASTRRESEQRALEEERRNHGSSLSRWFRDHFPFLF